MAHALNVRENELSKLGCELDSPVSLFWAKFAERRPSAAPNMRVVCENIARAISDDYCADEVQEMLMLMTEEQLQKVMAEAGGKATWIGMITYILGPFKPSTLNVPDSAKMALAPSIPVLPSAVKVEATYDILPLGQSMEADGTLVDDLIPEYVFNAYFECEDPLHQELSSKDVTAVLNAYTHFMITHHGQPAGDKAMRLWHGKQLKRRLKHLPTHGNTPGPMRKWHELLSERKRNIGRKDSKVRGKILTRARPRSSSAPTILALCASPPSTSWPDAN